MEYRTEYDSPLGVITLLAEDGALTALHFNRRERRVAASKREPTPETPPVLRETVRWLDIYFRGRNPGFTPNLLIRGTPFRRAVCRIMLAIPYGETTTYGAIAERIAAERGIPRMSAQAVGGAVGANPIALIIPCHRVIGKNGNLTGYGGGLDRKAKLLELEGIKSGTFFWPGEKRG